MKKMFLLLAILSIATASAYGDTIIGPDLLAQVASRGKLDDPSQYTNSAVRVDGETVATIGDVSNGLISGEPFPEGCSIAGVARRLADDWLLAREAKARGAASADAFVREGIAEPTEEELRAAWAAVLTENPSAGRVEETVEASHLLVLVPEGASADDDAAALEKVKALRSRILAGEDFAAVARESSNCPSRARGGSLGAFTRGVMVPAFEKAAFSQPVGVVGEPVRTEFGWHIILVTKREPARERRFEEVRDDLAELETGKRIEKRRLELLAPLREAATIEFDPDVDPAIEKNNQIIFIDPGRFLRHSPTGW